MTKYRKKPVVVDAVQYTGDNLEEVRQFVPEKVRQDKPLGIRTLEGVMLISVGDWIIKGVMGEYYPCKPEVFSETYEVADQSKGDTFEEWLWDVAKRVSIRMYEEYGRVVYVTTYVWGEELETYQALGFLRFYNPPNNTRLNTAIPKTVYLETLVDLRDDYVDSLTHQLAGNIKERDKFQKLSATRVK